MVKFFFVLNLKVMEKLVRKLGSEKEKYFVQYFDLIVNKYRTIADTTGYQGKLKFKTEKGKVVVFVELEE